MLKKYAELLVDYSLYLKKGETLYINTTAVAFPLLKEIYRLATRRQAHVEYNIDFDGKNEIFYEEAQEELLAMTPVFHKKALSEFDAYLYIRAPYSMPSKGSENLEKKKIRSEAMKSVSKIYFDRMTEGTLKRSLCQYPTEVNAQIAGMSLEEYQNFVFNACKLDEANPKAAWESLSREQQHIVDFLNQKSHIRYKNQHSNIEFSVAGRTWINSDGKTNMPSGEVFSSPVENTVNGHIRFDYPSIYMGQEVQGVELEVKDGQVVKWSADKGQDLLDKIMEIEGARYFGEVAIGTNYNIQQPTKNILFDEKIGGSIHMALGQSYGQTGGKNNSAIHWDMICDMKAGGEIYADDELIYRDGKFLIK